MYQSLSAWADAAAANTLDVPAFERAGGGRTRPTRPLLVPGNLHPTRRAQAAAHWYLGRIDRRCGYTTPTSEPMTTRCVPARVAHVKQPQQLER